MMAVAAGGLVVNLFGLWLLSDERRGNLNTRGAWLHVLTEALGSVGVIVGAGLIWAFGWYWADPAVSVVMAMLVIFFSWSLLKEAVAVLMEGAPGHLDVDRTRDAIMEVPGVRAVHDLQVWSITTGRPALSGHVRLTGDRPGAEVLAQLGSSLRDRFGIEHVTIQTEPAEYHDEPEHR